ncbi:MAG: hypothetical protein EBZ48_16085, partial [Proteobacteria bacterium]|nr:hypothetical protein [Pseudomonadota bacterium]
MESPRGILSLREQRCAILPQQSKRRTATSLKSTRIELRVVGSDANPYLAHAASLASGLYGISHKLKLPQVTKGNGYLDTTHGVLHRSLWDATQSFKNSEVAKELFGDQFVTHFAGTREIECKHYAKAVTDW